MKSKPYKPSITDWMVLLTQVTISLGMTLPLTKAGKLTTKAIGWLCGDNKLPLTSTIDEIIYGVSSAYQSDLTMAAQWLRVLREREAKGVDKYSGDPGELQQAYYRVIGLPEVADNLLDQADVPVLTDEPTPSPTEIPMVIPPGNLSYIQMKILGCTDDDFRNPELFGLDQDAFLEKTAFKDDPFDSLEEYSNYEKKIAARIKKQQDKQKAPLGFGAGSTRTKANKNNRSAK